MTLAAALNMMQAMQAKIAELEARAKEEGF